MNKNSLEKQNYNKKRLTSKLHNLRNDLKTEIFLFLNLFEIFENIIFLNKNIFHCIKKNKIFDKIVNLYNQNLIDVDILSTLEENISNLKNLFELDAYILEDIVLYKHFKEFQLNEKLNFSRKFILI